MTWLVYHRGGLAWLGLKMNKIATSLRGHGHQRVQLKRTNCLLWLKPRTRAETTIADLRQIRISLILIAILRRGLLFRLRWQMPHALQWNSNDTRVCNLVIAV